MKGDCSCGMLSHQGNYPLWASSWPYPEHTYSAAFPRATDPWTKALDADFCPLNDQETNLPCAHHTALLHFEGTYSTSLLCLKKASRKPPRSMSCGCLCATSSTWTQVSETRALLGGLGSQPSATPFFLGMMSCMIAFAKPVSAWLVLPLPHQDECILSATH